MLISSPNNYVRLQYLHKQRYQINYGSYYQKWDKQWTKKYKHNANQQDESNRIYNYDGSHGGTINFADIKEKKESETTIIKYLKRILNL